jgi:hypothetical protein
VTKVRRGGYVFLTWKSDHPPRHAHVLRDGRLVLKWDLELGRPMQGSASVKLAALIRELEKEGLL